MLSQIYQFDCRWEPAERIKVDHFKVDNVHDLFDGEHTFLLSYANGELKLVLTDKQARALVHDLTDLFGG